MAMEDSGSGERLYFTAWEGFKATYYGCACSKCGVIQVSDVLDFECISCKREATFRGLLDIHLSTFKELSVALHAAQNQIKALQEQVKRVVAP